MVRAAVLAFLLASVLAAVPGRAQTKDDPYAEESAKTTPVPEPERLARSPAAGSNLLVLLQPIRFTIGSTEIATISRLVLVDVAAVLNEHPEWTSVHIGGHTDSVGPAETNLALSLGRAKAVLSALVANGVAEGRLSAKGWGETKPVVDATDEIGHAKNRRVEFRVGARD